MPIHDHVHAKALKLLQANAPSQQSLNEVFRYLAKYRVLLLRNTLRNLKGTAILGGPFEGMKFADQTEGCLLPKMLGCYEQELHAFIRDIPKRGYETILDLGCAEGYYAVGLKRLFPGIRVLAYDIDPNARAACLALARSNQVTVEIGGEFKCEDFQRFAGPKTLVWCDIEGAELELLDLEQAPSLAEMDMVVEIHNVPGRDVEGALLARFARTHEIEVLEPQPHQLQYPDFMKRMGHLDQLLAQWEWRGGSTPWAVMSARRNL